MPGTPSSKPSYKQMFNLLKLYFTQSDQKLYAWSMLVGAAICIAAMVGLMALLTWLSGGIFAALTAKLWAPFLLLMGKMGLSVVGIVVSAVIKDYVLGKLSIHWRKWLSTKIIRDLFKDHTNLELQRLSSRIKNIAQRVQEDVRHFIKHAVDIGENFFKSALTLAAFTGSLWVAGGALSFVLLGLNIVIPGFLVWAALAVSIVATVATYFIARTLSKETQDVQQAEADLRQDLGHFNDGAENIAQQNAEVYYARSIAGSLRKVFIHDSINPV